MNKSNRLFVVGMTAALLSIPAFAQPLRLTDCKTILPAAQTRCNDDNALRTKCNATTNPTQCYNNKGVGAAPAAAATTSQTGSQQTAKPSPCQAQFDAWQKLAKNPTPNTTKDAQQRKFAWEACLARSK